MLVNGKPLEEFLEQHDDIVDRGNATRKEAMRKRHERWRADSTPAEHLRLGQATGSVNKFSLRKRKS